MNKSANSVKKALWILRLLKNFTNALKRHYPLMILVALGFGAVSLINFTGAATGRTVASYNLDEFEVNQIADRTILAPRSIPADEMNPVFVEEGEKIIRKGFPITEDAYAKLQKMAESPMYLDYRAFADLELALVLLTAMWFLLFAFAPFKHKVLLREFIFQVACFIVVYAAAVFGLQSRSFSSPFTLTIIIPASLFVLIQAVLYGQLSATFFSFMLSFGVFAASSWQIIPFVFTLSSCLASSAIVRKIARRIDMVIVALVLAFLDAVLISIIAVIFNEDLSRMPMIIAGVAANGFLSGILALGLITPVEFMLNTASVFRLMDLSDLNNPVMRKMLITASGTYQHSQMVAQLAESACRRIGADLLLARVAAYYHDMGKIDQSEYFTENQTDGINKHDGLKPSLSASIIRSHVKKGVEKARQMHFPEQVIDIIAEHHGNSLISYFYEMAKKEDPNVNPADFSYPGNPPATRESAVVMLADTVEAACRSLDNPTEERLSAFIQNLINAKVEHHQLDDCGLTFRDITKIRAEFIKILVGFYHNRIRYPNQSEMEKDKTAENAKRDEKEEKDEAANEVKPRRRSRGRKSAGKSNGE
ncbi:MAG: HD family phosphohydrolase [Treponema sp.]